VGAKEGGGIASEGNGHRPEVGCQLQKESSR
jgi:hypothetical protein